jgi:hypothetical protein
MSVSLKEKLLKNSTIKETAVLTESKVYNKKDMIPTPVPLINVALSGSFDGGLTPGLTVLAAPSKHFKSAFSLMMAGSFLRKYPDGIVLFYDSEFGTPKSYFTSFNVSTDSVIHTPITDLELLKFDISQQLNTLTRDDKVIIIIDSIGNLASKKEVDDALKGNSAADMTRAKVIKSIFRIVTPHLTLKDIPMVVVNHTYQTQEMYSKSVVSGGTGIMYSSDNVWIIGRQQDKDDEGLQGYHFIINVEKSRYVKEKSKIPITVNFDSGINKWSGLLDLALEGKFITKPKPGWYARVNQETGEIDSKNYRASDIVNNGEFWKTIFAETGFKKWIEEKYSTGLVNMLSED